MSKEHFSSVGVPLKPRVGTGGTGGQSFKKMKEISEYSVIPGNKLVRLLKLVGMFVRLNYVTINQIMSELEISPRTAYRYIVLLRESGINVEQIRQGTYHLKDCPFCKRLI